jgi:putative oxidoreductase
LKKLFNTRYTDTGLSIGLFLARIVFGGLMIPHGYSKLMDFSTKSTRFSDPFHIGHAPSLILVIFAEFFCAVLVVAGLMTRVACIPLIVAMAVALTWSHNGDFFAEGQEATLFLGGFILLLFAGPGRFSMDRAIGR